MLWGSSRHAGSCSVEVDHLSEPCSHSLRVRYGECDAQGVVFNSHYLAYLDVSMTELWRASFDGGYKGMVATGIDMVVAEARLRFRGAARFDDELTLTVEIERLGNTGMHSRHQILRGHEPLIEGEMRQVFVDLGTLAKTTIPDWARAGLAPLGSRAG